MKRIYKRIIMVVSDFLALTFALWSAYALRLSEWWPELYLKQSWWLFIAMPIVGVYVFMRLGLYHAIVRFMGVQAIWAVVKGVMFLALFLFAAATFFQINIFPRSVPINFALVALVYVGGSRLLVRHYYNWGLRFYSGKDAVLIYGAGGAGIQLATALCDGREYHPVGFIDDDPSLWKSTIKGLPVYDIGSLELVINQDNVKHILLAMPEISKKRKKSILDGLSHYGVHIQTIPSMPDLLEGKALVEQLREVEIDDILGRDTVPPMLELMSKCIKDKIVMITGAGGSIGAELCRQVLCQLPQTIILYEHSEYNLYQIENELQSKSIELKSEVKIISLLGSVLDKERVKGVLSRFSVDTIYHAAAYKHVPLVEKNIIEGATNNIIGTQTVAEEAAKSGVSHFILISTDKAVRPTNVMGATKRFAELILQSLSHGNSKTIFSMVRFGNVLGSSGSVVPLFRRQIKDGGPITVTHKEITRFFMTIPEAAALVIQAGSMSCGGDVFVLDMGEPVKIDDLATRMIKLSGLEVKTDVNPEGDIEISYTGLRPAEKLYEELILGDNVSGTLHSKIMKANEIHMPSEKLSHYTRQLCDACYRQDAEVVKDILSKAILGYQPHEELVDHLSMDDKKTTKLQ